MLVEHEDTMLAALADRPRQGADGGVCHRDRARARRDQDRAQAPRRVVPRRRRSRLPLTFKPGSAEIVPEPLGVVLIIAPWNYPTQLLLAPLVAALAAGNTVVLKPSEVAPATSAAMAELIPQYLDERVVTVVTGGVDETTELLAERFDHIFYTGNGTVGRIVMAAAAKHLTPVTLELGGKSPAIVAADADIDVAARRIAWGKFLNAGQTCVAPDYVLVDATVGGRADGRAAARGARLLRRRHPSTRPTTGGSSTSATGIGSPACSTPAASTRRCAAATATATASFIPPTVLAGVKPEAAVMQQEIFGPILPVLTVDDLDEAISFVNESRQAAGAVHLQQQRRHARPGHRTHLGRRRVRQPHRAARRRRRPALRRRRPERAWARTTARPGFDTFSHRKPMLRKPDQARSADHVPALQGLEVQAPPPLHVAQPRHPCREGHELSRGPRRAAATAGLGGRERGLRLLRTARRQGRPAPPRGTR